jgi:hypothetical protein
MSLIHAYWPVTERERKTERCLEINLILAIAVNFERKNYARRRKVRIINFIILSLGIHSREENKKAKGRKF